MYYTGQVPFRKTGAPFGRTPLIWVVIVRSGAATLECGPDKVVDVRDWDTVGGNSGAAEPLSSLLNLPRSGPRYLLGIGQSEMCCSLASWGH